MPRARHNQPLGFIPVGSLRPSYFRGARHDYIYYPTAWVDESTGTSYQSGYYDENGERYDNVAFEKNGTYENVVCKCEYCGQDAIVNLSVDDAAVKSVNCPHCGAPMSIRSELDQTVDSTEYAPVEETQAFQPQTAQSGTKKHLGRTILIAILVLFGLGRLIARQQAKQTTSWQTTVLQEIDNSEEKISLARTGERSFVQTSGSNADKVLVWDAESESYYDAETQYWLWYNTDMTPPVWQYWIDGISSDFGDYGWMEHDSDGWWIEASYGNWIKLPDKYDSTNLWYIED